MMQFDLPFTGTASLGRQTSNNLTIPPQQPSLEQTEQAKSLQPQLIQTELQALMQRMNQLLKENDANALELLETHRAVLEERLGSSLRRLESALQRFDFEAARLTLTQFIVPNS